jgi:hypothetical protein
MKFPVFSLLTGKFGLPETSSLETASSTSESGANGDGGMRSASSSPPRLWSRRSAGEQGRGRLQEPASAGVLAKHPDVAVQATGQVGYALDGHPFRRILPTCARPTTRSAANECSGEQTISRMACYWRKCKGTM